MEMRSVWVVDDEAELSKSYADYLSCDYNARYFVSAKDAVAAFEANEDMPDAVVSDIRMPEQDGIGFISELRKKKFDAPVVMISGHADRNDLMHATQLNISGFLEKPCEPSLLKSTIDKSIKAHDLARLGRDLLRAQAAQLKLLEEILSASADRYRMAEDFLMELNGTPTRDSPEFLHEFLALVREENERYRRLEVQKNEIAELRRRYNQLGVFGDI